MTSRSAIIRVSAPLQASLPRRLRRDSRAAMLSAEPSSRRWLAASSGRTPQPRSPEVEYSQGQGVSTVAPVTVYRWLQPGCSCSGSYVGEDAGNRLSSLRRAGERDRACRQPPVELETNTGPGLSYQSAAHPSSAEASWFSSDTRLPDQPTVGQCVRASPPSIRRLTAPASRTSATSLGSSSRETSHLAGLGSGRRSRHRATT
jgi:hypothetical protein